VYVPFILLNIKDDILKKIGKIKNIGAYWPALDKKHSEICQNIMFYVPEETHKDLEWHDKGGINDRIFLVNHCL